MSAVVSNSLSDCNAVSQFFEVSAVSFSPLYGRKGKEGWALTRYGRETGPTLPGRTAACLPAMVRLWERRWCVFKGNSLVLALLSFDEPEPGDSCSQLHLLLLIACYYSPDDTAVVNAVAAATHGLLTYSKQHADLWK